MRYIRVYFHANSRETLASVASRLARFSSDCEIYLTHFAGNLTGCIQFQRDQLFLFFGRYDRVAVTAADSIKFNGLIRPRCERFPRVTSVPCNQVHVRTSDFALESLVIAFPSPTVSTILRSSNAI